MKLRIVAPLAALALLAGCGKSDKPPAVSVSTATATVSTASGGASTTCDNLPDFAPLYAGAVVSSCFKAASTLRANHDSGGTIFTVKAAPAEVLAWYKDQAHAKGLADSLAAPTMYSARDGEKRTMMVLTSPKDGGAQVTINWGRDTGA